MALPSRPWATFGREHSADVGAMWGRITRDELSWRQAHFSSGRTVQHRWHHNKGSLAVRGSHDPLKARPVVVLGTWMLLQSAMPLAAGLARQPRTFLEKSAPRTRRFCAFCYQAPLRGGGNRNAPVQADGRGKGTHPLARIRETLPNAAWIEIRGLVGSRPARPSFFLGSAPDRKGIESCPWCESRLPSRRAF